ncbi:MAG: amidohydrolase family protein [Candidatus Brockarchaeota archaeon]|nr:amidohydrolase family protein [Candidatus Brockarchaeota archaeon]
MSLPAPTQGDVAYYDAFPVERKDVVDVHLHYSSEKGFVEKLLKEMDGAGVKVACLISSGPDCDEKEEAEWRAIFKDFGDRIFGLGLFKPGRCGYEVVDGYYSKGFKGLKAIEPKKPYDEDEYLRYYERAEEYGMPILFHTGVVARGSTREREDVSSGYMRPIHLDRIARWCPKLKIIAAHMGDPWFSEAYNTSQKNPNMWLDISGKGIWLKASAIREHLWIRLRPEKLLFGLDEPPTQYRRIVHAWETILYEMGISQEQRDMVFSGTARRVLSL